VVKPDGAPTDTAEWDVAVIGGGPAGLMAAEAAARAGARVALFERMASPGRKFLLAGKGGLNLTHAEALERFHSRFDQPDLRPALDDFPPEAIRAWAAELGIPTITGSSARVFPVDYKSAPLLRRWLTRLRSEGVVLKMRHRWCGGLDPGDLRFETPAGTITLQARAMVLALGGASWPQLGSDGAWVAGMEGQGVSVAALAASNCGVEVLWSEFLRGHHAGAPLKSIVAWVDGGSRRKGECIVSEYGLEGGLIYALGAELRTALASGEIVSLHLDLAPDVKQARLAEALARPRGKRTLASHLQRQAGLAGVKVALLHELLPREALTDTARLAAGIKDLLVSVRGTRPVSEAISTAGGIRFEGLDEGLMLSARPGVFCAGEMLDWDAPTGGYLLSACLASGRWAGRHAAAWLV